MRKTIIMVVMLFMGSMPVQATELQFANNDTLRFQNVGDKRDQTAQQPEKTQQETNPMAANANANAYYRVIYRHILQTSPGLNAKWADWVANTIIADSCKYNVNPLLAAALFTQESGFNMSATSRTGAVGVAQLMPDTARSLGVDYTDPAQNIDGGIHYLAQQLSNFRDAGTWQTSFAIAAYNAGPTCIRKYGCIPPYEETQNHVANVTAIYARLENEYENINT